MNHNYRANIIVMCNVWNEQIILCKFVPKELDKTICNRIVMYVKRRRCNFATQI